MESSQNKVLRKDFSKALTKLEIKKSDERKNVSGNISGTFAETQSKSIVSKSVRGTISKIPTKCVTLSKVNSQRVSRLPSRSQSADKQPRIPIRQATMEIKEVNPIIKKKLEANSIITKNNDGVTFKSGLKSPTPITSRASLPKRPPIVPKRSASLVSYKNMNTARGEESANFTSKFLPIGDHEICGLSARERVAENNKLLVFEGMHKKLQDLQSEFMIKYENLKISSPEKLKTSYKFITMIKNEECKLVVKDEDNLRVPRHIPAESISDFKEKMKRIVKGFFELLMENLKEIETMESQYGRTIELQALHDKLDKAQDVKVEELFKLTHQFCSSNNENDSQISKLQKDLLDTKKTLQMAEKKISEMITAHAEEVKRLVKENKEKLDTTIIKKDVQITELQKKAQNFEIEFEKLRSSLQQSTDESIKDQIMNANMREELKSCKENMANQNKKLTNLEQQLLFEQTEKLEREKKIDKLKAELTLVNNAYDTLRSRSNEVQFQNKLNEKIEEINQLKETINQLTGEHNHICKEIDKLQSQYKVLSKVCDNLSLANKRISDLEKDLVGHKKLLTNASEATNIKEITHEFAKLRQADAEKRREIEKLKVELSKCKYSNSQLSEQIDRDRQLLDVRSELINSLQQNDNSQRVHMEELFAQVSDKNSSINELNNELRTKTEEFQNLFSTLSTKQIELTRQEHMIKLLEESNERSQMLRVKQEEKMSRMEEEIAHLKQTITLLQKNSVSKNAIIGSAPNISSEYPDNEYRYRNERQRKRQVNINVKKYEA